MHSSCEKEGAVKKIHIRRDNITGSLFKSVFGIIGSTDHFTVFLFDIKIDLFYTSRIE
ncbi:MAG: hypothetical protein NT166_04030 [Candidatus Aminicenantes bacterium]|nr:hypothetical protein [Candidatus Aminicenantes bacterium]